MAGRRLRYRRARCRARRRRGGAGALVTSTIASEGALLSATARGTHATGGLLVRLGQRGVLVIKDMGTLLSMDIRARGVVFAALREIYDGRWERNVGIGGGRTLTWAGRIAVVGASTTAWDSAHSVITIANFSKTCADS